MGQRKLMFTDDEHKCAVHEHIFMDGEHKFAEHEFKIRQSVIENMLGKLVLPEAYKARIVEWLNV